MERMEPYLRATDTVDCGKDSIKEKAANLTRSADNVVEKAKRLFYFVRDEIKYNPYLFTNVFDEFKASRVLGIEAGFCIQKAVLLAALARASGIPARLRFANIRNHLLSKEVMKVHHTNLLPYHGYNELYINGRWVKATPTFDLKLCEQNRIIPVEFDGTNDATLHPRNRDGRLHIEYIQDHGHFDDLPFKQIIDANLRVCGSDYFERFSKFLETDEDQETKSFIKTSM